MSKSRIVVLGVVGLVIAGSVGLWMYIDATLTPLHSDPKQIPSSMNAAAVQVWTAPVAQARDIVRASLVEQNLPGLSVAVGVNGAMVWAEGFGFADVDKRTPVTANHRFRIGTASTVLTSAAVGLLLDEGRLKLDDVIQTHVPAFPAKRWPVTLRQLMGHVAGVRTDGGDEGPLFSQQCERPADALGHFAGRSLLFEPGTKFRYSSYGWILVSAAVEAAAEKPFLTFMREKVFDPLGMRDTMADSARDSTPNSDANRPTFYFPRFAADPVYGLHLMRDLNLSCYSGSSVFLSTPSDLVRFGMAMNSGKFLRPGTVRLLQTSQRLASGEETGYGLGWDLETVTLGGKQAIVAGHDGEMLGGMVSSLVTVPEQGIVVSVISNISYADTFSLGVKIAEVFAEQGKSPAPR